MTPDMKTTRAAAGVPAIDIGGSVTAPVGFRAAGIACGIKKNGNADLALIVSDVPAAAAAVFTTNKAQAAPVLVARQRLPGHRSRECLRPLQCVPDSESGARDKRVANRTGHGGYRDRPWPR